MKALVIINCIIMIAIGGCLFFDLRHIVPLFSAVVLVQGIAQIIRYFVPACATAWILFRAL